MRNFSVKLKLSHSNHLLVPKFLSKLLKDEFHLTQSDVEELVDEMEELIALYVLQTSPKFTGEPEVDPLDEWDHKYEEKAGK